MSLCVRNTTAMRCAWLLGALAPAAIGAAYEFVPDQAVVRLHVGVDIEAINADYGTTTLDSIVSRNTWLLHVPPGWDEEALEIALEADPRVADAELNESSDSPGGNTQSFYFHVAQEAFVAQYAWGHVGLDSPQAATAGVGVVVAVLDTGLEAEHEAFAGTTILPGWNYIDDTADTDDSADGLDNDGDELIDEMVGHGTFTAAIIAHMAPAASILPVRVLNDDGQSTAFTVTKGIYRAIEDGAHVINLSLGMTAESEVIKDALEVAKEHGIIVVASAGNDNEDDVLVYPAAVSNVIGVGATDDLDHKTAFSNYGQHVNLCAPGSGIVSAIPGGAWGQADGTSEAAAIVSGAAALLKAADPSLSPSALRFVLYDTAFDLDVANPGYAGKLGHGRLDVAAALAQVLAPTLDGDLNGDSVVDAIDFLLLLQGWGTSDPVADIDGDGTVGAMDMLILLGEWS